MIHFEESLGVAAQFFTDPKAFSPPSDLKIAEFSRGQEYMCLLIFVQSSLFFMQTCCVSCYVIAVSGRHLFSASSSNFFRRNILLLKQMLSDLLDGSRCWACAVVQARDSLGSGRRLLRRLRLGEERAT